MPAVAVPKKRTRPTWVSDLLAGLGDISPDRVRFNPLPGTATDADVIRLNESKDEGLFELIDGTLVAKDMSVLSSRIGGILFREIDIYATTHKLGLTFPADTMVQLADQVRLPDVSFVSWSRLPSRRLPRGAVLDVGIDLAIEVLSPGNRPGEMLRKRREYFAAGARQVWEIDPETQSARVYSSTTKCRDIGPDDSLEGGRILPGFSLPLARLFAEAGPRE